MPLGINIGGFGSTTAAWPGVSGTNAGIPQGPATAASAGFGINSGAGSSGLDAKTTGTLSVGTLALAALVYIWWSLPR